MGNTWGGRDGYGWDASRGKIVARATQVEVAKRGGGGR